MEPEGILDECEKTNKLTSHILELPDELLSYIFSYLTGEELVLNVAPVCEKFTNIIRGDAFLWKKLWLVWDTNITCSLNKVLDYAPCIHRLRVRHPGSISNHQLLEIFETIFNKVKDLSEMELECHGTQPSYPESVVQSIIDGCGETLLFLSIRVPMKQQAIANLCHLSHLTTLKLSCCPNFLGEHLRRVAIECPDLQWLSIPRSAYIKDEDLCLFIRHKQSLLIGLELSGYLITDVSLQLLSECCHLSHVSVEDSRRLSWGTLCALSKLSSLRFLRLHRLGARKEDVLRWISSACSIHHLRVLDLRHGYNIDDDVAILVAEKCHSLKQLYLRNTVPFSTFTCFCIAQSLKYIEETDVSCPVII